MPGTRSTATPTESDPADDPNAEPERRFSTGTAAWQKVVAIIGLVVLFWVGDRYYDVVTFDGMVGPNVDHGPGDVDDGGPGEQSPTGVQNPPAEPPDQAPDVDPGGRESDHDPSQFDHD